jgi:hypothetical protein
MGRKLNRDKLILSGRFVKDTGYYCFVSTNLVGHGDTPALALSKFEEMMDIVQAELDAGTKMGANWTGLIIGQTCRLCKNHLANGGTDESARLVCLTPSWCATSTGHS